MEIGPERPCGYLPGRRTAHCPTSVSFHCFNVYLNPGEIRCGRGIVGLEGPLPPEGVCGLLARHRSRHCPVLRQCAKAAPAKRPPDLDETVARLAQLSGMSREGFSRHFKRAYGLPPQAFQIMARLNSARELLREGKSPIIAASEAGFADQSHMGRHFRRFLESPPAVSDRESHIRSRNPPPIRYRPKQRYPLLRRLLWKT